MNTLKILDVKRGKQSSTRQNNIKIAAKWKRV